MRCRDRPPILRAGGYIAIVGRDIRLVKGAMLVLSKPIQDAMNEQIKNELFSAYQYLSM